MSLEESELEFLALEIAKRAIPELNVRLRAHATEAGWPDNIVNSLTVAFDGGDIYIDYPEPLADEIDDLEYGKPFALPTPVIRPFIARNSALVVGIMASITLDQVLQLEEVF